MIADTGDLYFTLIILYVVNVETDVDKVIFNQLLYKNITTKDILNSLNYRYLLLKDLGINIRGKTIIFVILCLVKLNKSEILLLNNLYELKK